MKTYLLPVLWTLLFHFSLTAQNVHYGECFELNSTLNASQSHEYTANSHIDLNPGFDSNPNAHQSTTLQLDPYGIHPPTAGVTGGSNTSSTGVVGAIGGTVDVGHMGAAVYTIPIEIPAGINGMQPGLAITYNSQAGNGLLGWGWDLTGVSAITRAGTTLYHDGYMSGADFDDDRFYLDGQRLMVVSGSYGADGAEYKTEVDGMSKVVSYTCDTTNGPAKFKVWTANGLVLEYGGTSESRIGLHQRNDVCLWLLNRVEDRNGNYMTYHYNRGGASYQMTRIKYTYNDAVRTDPPYEVSFLYDDRDDKEQAFVGNNSLKQNKLLKEINVKYDNDSVLWHYYFNYDSSTGLGTKDAYHRLTSIRFKCGNQSYNPTTITWNQSLDDTNTATLKVDGNIFHYDYSTHDYLDLGDIKFTGDFNGDGYTDLITTWYEGNQKVAYVYLNSSGRSGDLWELTRIDTLNIDDNVDWVYTGDFNGDGLTDLLFMSRDRDTWISYYDFVTFDFYLTQKDSDGSLSFVPCASPQSSAYWVWHSKGVSMAMGDFLGNRKDSFVFQTVEEDKHTYKRFYIYYDDTSGEMRQENIGGINPNAECMQAADFNGDGITELWYYKTDENVSEGKIIKLDQNKNFVEVNSSVLTRYHKVFPGDFNGDGKADFLSFARDGNGGGTWQINLSKEGCLFWPQFDITDEMGIGDPGDHGFSMQSRYLQMYQFKMVAVADFNGDGKSDIATRKNTSSVNDSLVILYAPFNTDGCAYRQAFPKSLTGMGTASEFEAVIGNFIGRENTSVYWHDDLFYITPNSERYTVESITDGMGNTVSFDYGYLMPDLQNINWDGFYTMNNTLENKSEGTFSVSLPIKAASKITERNAGGGIMSIDYLYEGALVQTRGKGFLGFTKRTTTRKNNSTVLSRTVTRGDRIMLAPYPMVVPQCDSVFDKNDNLVSYTQYNYTPFVNNRDILSKVFIPLMTMETHRTYDLDHHLFQKKSCVTTSYVSDITGASIRYDNTLKPSVKWHGTTDDNSVTAQQDYEFQTTETTEYEADMLQTWILNRPQRTTTVISRNGGYENVSRLVSYTYKQDNPTLVESVTNLPNNGSDLNDPLAVRKNFDYDSFGHVTNETVTAPNDNALPGKTTTYQYGSDYGYRFLTSKSLPMGYASTYTYDEYYGFLTSDTDCNGRMTRYEQDPLGITLWTYYPDNTVSCLATRWNGHTGYYSWSKSSGEASQRSFYGSKGQLKSTLTYGIRGEKILTQTQYDQFGRVQKESLPYFEEDAVLWTNYTYDDYGRLTTVAKPDGVLEETVYDGLTTTRVTRPVDGTTQETSSTSNIMGWTVSASEKLDGTAENTVTYDYYADGALAWAKVNGQAGMCDSLRYDHNGNRVYLKDPNYGAVNSVYNAFGQLVSETSPKGDVAVYTYDLLGRTTNRTVTHNTLTLETATWTYDESEGQKGLLSSIVHDNQTLTYGYDDQLRVSRVTNAMGNESHVTTYTYDVVSRLSSETYPSGVSVRYGYWPNGCLRDIADSHNRENLWKLSDANPKGQPTKIGQGNAIVTGYTYDDLTGRLTGIQATRPGGNTTLQHLTYDHDGFGNLLSRTDHRLNNGSGITETFTYDRLNRLGSVMLNSVQTGQTLFDDYGRITSKNANGQTVFTTNGNSYDMADKPHALKSATVPEGLFPNATLNISYTHFDKVNQITEGNNSLSYTYGYDRQRIFMEEHVGSTTRTKRYVGNCELVTESEGNSTSTYWLTYLTGPTGVYAVVVTQNGTDEIHYILKDNLGSWTTITDGDGVVEQRLSYDAWGNLRNPNTWSGSFSGTPMFDRGFTGHEHLYNFGLVNMNGRMYDPVVSSFLSVDQYVSNPSSSQNFNRYSYCLNNPLRYVDPDGEDPLTVAILVGAVIGSFTNTAAQLMSGNVNNGTQFWLAVGIGAISGALGGAAGYGAGYGMNVLLKGAEGFWLGFVASATSSFAGGFVSTSSAAWMQGASFSKGFWAGMESGGWGALIGGILGGVESGYNAKQCGGDFWTGEGITHTRIDPNPNESWVKEIDERLTYSNEYLQKFSDENGLYDPSNLNESYADGTCPVDWHRKGSYFTQDDLTKVLAVSRNTGFGNYNCYYAPAAFVSPEELYLTIAHEHLHLQLYGLGYTKKGLEDFHHASISRFEYAQAKRWNYNVSYYKSVYDSYKKFIYYGNYIDYYKYIIPISTKPYIP
ncbi:MAG: VCBS repeat-containing protein [Bacteroidales bacterium]|nr:VCBS repeat-containing protein [Bacteroidales bacterium]